MSSLETDPICSNGDSNYSVHHLLFDGLPGDSSSCCVSCFSRVPLAAQKTQNKNTRAGFWSSFHWERLLSLGVDSPFFPTIVILKNQLIFPGFLGRRIPGKNWEGTPRLAENTSSACRKHEVGFVSCCSRRSQWVSDWLAKQVH